MISIIMVFESGEFVSFYFTNYVKCQTICWR